MGIIISILPLRSPGTNSLNLPKVKQMGRWDSIPRLAHGFMPLMIVYTRHEEEGEGTEQPQQRPKGKRLYEEGM